MTEPAISYHVSQLGGDHNKATFDIHVPLACIGPGSVVQITTAGVVVTTASELSPSEQRLSAAAALAGGRLGSGSGRLAGSSDTTVVGGCQRPALPALQSPGGASAATAAADNDTSKTHPSLSKTLVLDRCSAEHLRSRRDPPPAADHPVDNAAPTTLGVHGVGGHLYGGLNVPPLRDEVSSHVTSHGPWLLPSTADHYDMRVQKKTSIEHPLIEVKPVTLARQRALLESSAALPSPAVRPTSPANVQYDYQPTFANIETILLKKGYVKDVDVGQGHFGEVLSAHSVATQERVAIKVTKPNMAAAAQPCGDLVHRHLLALRELSHENLVTYVDWFSKKNRFFLVMEYVPGGNLMKLDQDMVNGYCEVSGDYPADVFRQIVTAVSFLHGHGVAHSDLKPTNILLTLHNQVKISDCGLARLFASSDKAEAETEVLHPFRAPEAARLLEQYDRLKADVYSVGLLLYFMLHHETPFEAANTPEDLEELKLHTCHSSDSIPNLYHDERVGELLWQIVKPEPRDRPAIDRVARHPYVASAQRSQTLRS